MRVRLSGDHSAYHSGSAAVWGVLLRALEGAGLTLAQSGDYDALIVNGEGSMHHGRPTFHKKMGQLAEAVESGKAAYLVNTVWDENPSDYDALMKRMDGVIARDRLSQNQLRERHGVDAALAPDLSYFAPAGKPSTVLDYNRGIVVTDFYDPDLGDFRWWGEPFGRYASLDLKSLDWGQAVAALKSASVLITGRHHAIYAACKARVPFIPVRSNCHKMEAVADLANVPVPLAESPEEALDLAGWALANKNVFDWLFNWLEAQDPGSGFPALAGTAQF